MFYGAAQIWLAHRDPRPNAVLCAAWLCPEEFSSKRIYDLEQEIGTSHSDRAMADLQRALMSDPSSPYRWTDLGEALLRVHQTVAATYCFRRGVQLGPRNPTILLRAGNFFFRIHDYRDTMQTLSAVLRDPELASYYTFVFLTYNRMDVPIADMLTYGVPPVASVAQAFLRTLIQDNRLADARTTWKWMFRQSLCNKEIAGEYITFLIRNHEFEEAADTWADTNSDTKNIYRKTNWAFNGGFERVPQPSPLDWSIQEINGVKAGRTQNFRHDGRTSLEVTFEGKENVDYHGAFEDVVVSPGTWHLSALIKAKDITTDRGVQLQVFDPSGRGNLDKRTEETTGTCDWTRLDLTFEIGPQTHLVRIQLIRQPSLKFDNKITGTVWIDSVELQPQTTIHDRHS